MSTPQPPEFGEPQQPGQYPGRWGAPPDPSGASGYPGPGSPPANPWTGSQPPHPASGRPYPVADQPPPGSYPAPLPGSYPAPLPGGNPPTSDTYGPPPGAYPPPYQQAGQLPPGSVIPGQPGPPPATAKKAMTTQRIVILSIIGVLVVGVGIWAFLQSKSATINANVGDCVQVSGSVTASNPDTEQIDCNDPKALFVVTATGDETMQCEDGETEYYQKNSKGDVTDRVCMLPNVQTGDCFVPAPTVVQLPQVGDCSTLTGSTKVKVLLVDRTTSDESKCPADKIGAYSSVARHILICFGKAS